MLNMWLPEFWLLSCNSRIVWTNTCCALRRVDWANTFCVLRCVDRANTWCVLRCVEQPRAVRYGVFIEQIYAMCYDVLIKHVLCVTVCLLSKYVLCVTVCWLNKDMLCVVGVLIKWCFVSKSCRRCLVLWQRHFRILLKYNACKLFKYVRGTLSCATLSSTQHPHLTSAWLLSQITWCDSRSHQLFFDVL